MDHRNKKIKIAFIKQDVYQDLYVCSHKEKDWAKVLFSSQGRVGPIGLMTELDADFFIIEEEKDKETQIYKKVLPALSKYLHILKTQTLDKIPGQEFKQPGSLHAHGEFSMNCYDIDWGKYDIVVSVNITLPTKLILKYPQTLFAYMIGEANMASDKAYFGYDVAFNQMSRGIIANKLGVIDFPYTFVRDKTLETILFRYLGRPSHKKGVFIEINSSEERPVTKPPEHFQPLIDLNYDMNLHKQNIKDNLVTIYDSKYFLKMGGRHIRGNSAAEAISSGVLVIMNRDEIISKELIIDQCNVKTMDEAIALIQKLDNDNELYNELLIKQQQALNRYFFDAPLQSLINCMEIVKTRNSRKYAFTDKLRDHICLFRMNLWVLGYKIKTSFKAL